MTQKQKHLVLLASVLMIFVNGLTYASQIELFSPNLDKIIVGKRPVFKWKCEDHGAQNNMLVLLDGTDVTAMVECNGSICSFRPILPLPAGDHILEISWENEAGAYYTEAFGFKSRQSRAFKEIYSKNSTGLTYQMVLRKDDMPQQPNSRVDGDWSSENRVSTNYWTFSARGELRYVDQDHPIEYPEKKGFDLISFLLESVYERGDFRMDSQLGDIIVTESQNTVNNYARKGGQIFLNYKVLGLHLFSTNTAQYYGLHGGLGVDIDPNDKLYGVSGTVSLLDNHVTLRSMYAKGGEEGSSFGISTVEDRRRGKVGGFIAESNWFNSRLRITGEYDISEYDASTKDEFGPESDKAYRASLAWDDATYGFSGTYEYMGPDYEVIGNQGLPKNREGFSLASWITSGFHRFEFMFSRYNDNVKDNKLYPKVYDIQGGVKYSWNKLPNLPISIYYQKVIQNSTDEPEYTPEIYFDTDSVGADVSWLKGAWNLNFHTAYSYQNDKAHVSGDTATITFVFAPGYTGNVFRFNPSFSYNKSISHLRDVETDTYMANWDMEWQLTDKVLWSFAGNYNITEADDDSVDQQNLDIHTRLAFCIMPNWKHFIEEPTVGIRGRYTWQDDRVFDRSEDSFMVLIDFTTNVNFTF
ncbi:MAG: hypothetical protein GXO58_07285 [Thermodesulfobacteria bacterium]|nr:hypothetical protein [Thermodesulfobacteriota bacterium]